MTAIMHGAVPESRAVSIHRLSVFRRERKFAGGAGRSTHQGGSRDRTRRPFKKALVVLRWSIAIAPLRAFAPVGIYRA
ncbi:hypothetical protein QH494_22810 [Sphingomonas sp. AR_OL41]|uniref:hypothetical protein n=1 Tax=Sphingomonas sp. AR_OL41 TaxID=3042729 RepID=UPI002480BE60|nr:hypothetical protein [Sphingomonas sp. AR_OL41]MDH7975025.1 hypothetical protein [Sphingomonas sp. AR_OL41]